MLFNIGAASLPAAVPTDVSDRAKITAAGQRVFVPLIQAAQITLQKNWWTFSKLVCGKLYLVPGSVCASYR